MLFFGIGSAKIFEFFKETYIFILLYNKSLKDSEILAIENGE